MKGNDGKRIRRTGLRRRSLTALMLLLLIAFLIAVNITVTQLEKKQGWRLDYSFNGIATQSEATVKVLKELEYPVHIYAMFLRGKEDAPLMELLDRYASSSEQITWEQVDPSLNPALVTRFSGDTETVSSDSLIVFCETTGRWKILTPADFLSLSLDEESGTYTYAGYTYEQALTGAIINVSRDVIPRVVIVQGHGELDAESLSAFDTLLADHHYETVYQDLSDADCVPDPEELLVFFSPLRDLSEPELEKLTAITAKGGSVLFTCDYSDPVGRMPNNSALMRSYGFVPLEGIVVADRDDANSYYNNLRIDLIPKMLSTDITMDLVASGADTVLLTGSRAFQNPTETDRGLIVSPVLQSGKTAYLKSLSGNMTSLEKTEGDVEGPFALALQSRRITGEGYVTRAFILGCSSLLTEEQIYAMTDSRQLVIRILEFLFNSRTSDLQIVAKNAVRPALSVKGNGMGSLIVAALPLAVLMVALLVLIPRRNR